MKNIVFWCWGIVIISVLCTCRKKEPLPETQLFEWGEANAVLNGETWASIPGLRSAKGAGHPDHFYLIFNNYSSSGSLRSHLGFIFLTFSREKFTIHRDTLNRLVPDFPQASFASRLLDGDVAGSLYHLIDKDSIEDFVEITKIDSTTKEIWGVFQISFEIDSLSKADAFDKSLPDTLVFKNGTFHTKIVD